MNEERRSDVINSRSTVKLYIGAAVGLAIVTIGAVVTLAIMVPNNAAVITVVIGITSPLILSLLGAALHSVATVVDGQMKQLLRTTADKERAQGLIEGLKENPKVNIE